MITRTDHNLTYGPDGVLISDVAVVVDITEQANRATIEGRVVTLLGQLDTIVNTSGTLTAAQLSGAVRQIATGLRAVVRLQANRLDSAD